jgi:hypothetical protein
MVDIVFNHSYLCPVFAFLKFLVLLQESSSCHNQGTQQTLTNATDLETILPILCSGLGQWARQAAMQERQGIPIIYCGQEQGTQGNSEPYNCEALRKSG